MIVDCHTHIWQSPEQLGDGALAELSRPMSVSGQKMRLLPQADTANHLLASEVADRSFVIGFKSQYLNAEIPNTYIADYCREHPDKMIGFAGIDPTLPDAVDEVKHVSKELKLSGLTICPAAQDFHPSDTRAMEVYEAAAVLGLPIIFYPGTHLSPRTKMEYARPYLLDDVARTFPKLKIVVAHFGYPWVDEAITLLGKHANVYSDVSSLLRRPWVAYDALVRAYQFGVLEKLLFGSDFPFTTAAESIETLYTINHVAMGTNMPSVPREGLRGIVERDALALLGIARPKARVAVAMPRDRRIQQAG
jgi:predicted TIM-barrel fold metal-dependent hydrolase